VLDGNIKVIIKKRNVGDFRIYDCYFYIMGRYETRRNGPDKKKLHTLHQDLVLMLSKMSCSLEIFKRLKEEVLIDLRTTRPTLVLE